MRKFVIGQCVRSANEPELGLGFVSQIDAQTIDVSFSKSLEKRRYSLKSAPLERCTFSVGQEVILRSGKNLKILSLKETLGVITYETSEGHIEEKDIFASKENSNPLDNLRDGRISAHSAFDLRKQTLSALYEYKNSAMHGFLGSRIVLTPHQLYAVDKVASMSYPRALLADEVGLGKTIEAALIFSKLKAQGKVKKVLVLVPEALKHQWLSELYRKFLELFTLVDEERWEEEKASQGTNSFAANSFVIASLDLLIKERESFEAAIKEKWDMVIVDEAHQLVLLEEKEPETMKFFWQLSESVKSLLFLTATPFRFGEKNFELLKSLLSTSHEYPIEYIHNRRDVIQGFPQRLLFKHEYQEESSEKWLDSFLRNSQEAKLLVLCKSEEFATKTYKHLVEKCGHNAALFVESMDLIHRDKQAAWFASEDGARVLVCSEMGSEGRNFQFCHDMILMDLPDNPDILEQRIGRLDRIGQSEDVKIHVPYKKDTPEHLSLRLYEEVYGIFSKPCPFAFKIEDALKELPFPSSNTEWKAYREKAVDIFEDAENDYIKKVQKGVDERSFNAEKAQSLLAEIRKFEKSEKQDVVFEGLMEHFGVSHDDFGIDRTIKLGSESLMFVENFPHLGAFEEKAITFDRSVALMREDIEFLSFEHPLYQSTLDYFFGQSAGVAGISFSEDIPQRSFILETYFSNATRICMDDSGLEVKTAPLYKVSKQRKIQPSDAQKMFSAYSKQIKNLVDKCVALAQKKNSAAELDSLHIYIGLS